MKLVLGNRDAVESRDNGDTFERMPKGKRATEFVFPEGISLLEAFQVVTGGGWAAHVDTTQTDKDGAVVVPSPAWVASDNGVLADMVSENFGGVEVRELEEDHR
jgi:hypothetical protein